MKNGPGTFTKYKLYIVDLSWIMSICETIKWKTFHSTIVYVKLVLSVSSGKLYVFSTGRTTRKLTQKLKGPVDCYSLY